MKIIMTMVLAISYLSAGMFDKASIFIENKGNNNHENKILIKALIEKTINFKESSIIQS